MNICKFFRTGRAHKRRAEEVDAQRERIEEQWPEVRENTEWSRAIRRNNHLTDLFYASITGGETRG